MIRMKVAFVLLHYNNFDITDKAIKYLKLLPEFGEFEIVVVDNASPNGTGKELQREYSDVKKIHVILNEKNGGFAYGNNIGYQFAKNDLGCDTIVVMNNDVFIYDKAFITKMKKIVEATDDDIIAPDIHGRNGRQNPFRSSRITDKRMKQLYRYNVFINFIYRIPIVNVLLCLYLEKRSKKKKDENICNCYKSNTTRIACVPHGSCVIYTPSWVGKENIAFLPDTFMYFEEDILAEYTTLKKYKVMYEPSLEVYHVEDASVEYDQKTALKKRKFISGCMVRSIRILINMRRISNQTYVLNKVMKTKDKE